jgi:hypothetical protein
LSWGFRRGNGCFEQLSCRHPRASV